MRQTPGIHIPNDEGEVWIPDSRPDTDDKMPRPNPNEASLTETEADLPPIQERG